MKTRKQNKKNQKSQKNKKSQKNNKKIKLKTLEKKDYQTILDFYKIPTKNLSSYEIREKAIAILSKKLCKCVKKLEGRFRGRAFGICTKTVINSKGFRRNSAMSCRKTKKVRISKI
jgi:effector-binding domain-containing protein